MSRSYLSGMGYHYADCVTCMDSCQADRDKIEPQRAWARRHADANPGHSVHVTTERTRVYRADHQPTEQVSDG